MTKNVFHPAPRTASTSRLEDVQTVTWGELANQSLRHRPFLIDPILREGQAALIYGPTGVGKSWLALSFAVTAASGDGAEFLDFCSYEDGARVLLIDTNTDLEDLRRRIDIVGIAVNADEEALRDNLIVASRQHQHFGTDFPDIHSEAWRNAMLDYCGRLGVQLLVVDAIANLTASNHDDLPAAVASSLNALLQNARQRGIACLIVHDGRTSIDCYAFSAALSGTLDTIIRLDHDDTYRHNPRISEPAFKLIFEKARHGVWADVVRPRSVFLYWLDLEWHDDGFPGDQRYRLQHHLETGEYRSPKELGGYLGVSGLTVRWWINRAVARGEFSRADVKRWFREAREEREALCREYADAAAGSGSAAVNDNEK